MQYPVFTACYRAIWHPGMTAAEFASGTKKSPWKRQLHTREKEKISNFSISAEKESVKRLLPDCAENTCSGGSTYGGI